MSPRVIAVMALSALAVAGSVVGASAATLGGLQTADVAAATGTVAIHTSGITATWTGILIGGSWGVNGLTLTTSGTDRFEAGEQVRVALISAAGMSLCELAMRPSSGPVTTLILSGSGVVSQCGVTRVPFSSIDRVAITAVR